MPMHKVYLRFYAELDEVLSPTKRGSCLVHGFDTTGSVKDVIEAFGVPHTEIGLILINGKSVDFSCLLNEGDRISVYPIFRSLEINAFTCVRPAFKGERRFVLDTHLGRLAAYLRMLGFDSLYRSDYHDEELARISGNQQRTLLTRDRGLLKLGIVIHGYLVREAYPRHQMIEVLSRFDLFASISPFRRSPLQCTVAGGSERIDSKSFATKRPSNTTTSSTFAAGVIESTGKDRIISACKASSATLFRE